VVVVPDGGRQAHELPGPRELGQAAEALAHDARRPLVPRCDRQELCRRLRPHGRRRLPDMYETVLYRA